MSVIWVAPMSAWRSPPECAQTGGASDAFLCLDALGKIVRGHPVSKSPYQLVL